MKKSDIELVEAARSGDATALETLLQRHELRVYRFGLRMCGSEEEAKEVLQETLLTAFQGIHQFRGEAELSTWLYQVARSHCSRLMRRRAGEPDEKETLDSPESITLPSGEALPDERTHARQIGDAIEAAVRALPEKLREAVLLRDVEGLNTDEAAAVVGIEVRAFKSRLHRGRLQLRENLAVLLGETQGEAGVPCKDLAEELAAWAGEEIDQAACIRLEEHLSRCPGCSTACDELKRSVSLCRRIPGDEVPAPVRSAVRRALKAYESATSA